MLKVPFSPPDITEEEINEVVEALKSGWITTGKRSTGGGRSIKKWLDYDRTKDKRI